MIITQDAFIQKIAKKEKIDTALVKQLFQSAENILFDCLSTTAPSEYINIKLFNGIHIERNYVQQKTYSKGMFQNIDCPAHVKTKAEISKYYNGQVNSKLFKKYRERRLQ